MNEHHHFNQNSQEAGEDVDGSLPTKQTSLVGLAVVSCAEMLIGLDVRWVREVRPFAGATPIYGLPPCWVGICALRGHLYAVLDLQRVLSHQQTPSETPSQIVFTAVNEYLVGLLVDAVQMVQQVEVESIRSDATESSPDWLGSTHDNISLLDLPSLYNNLSQAAINYQVNV
jgi:chemotaxis signal transduction protein